METAESRKIMLIALLLLFCFVSILVYLWLEKKSGDVVVIWKDVIAKKKFGSKKVYFHKVAELLYLDGRGSIKYEFNLVNDFNDTHVGDTLHYNAISGRLEERRK